MLELFNESNLYHKEYPFEIKSFIVPIQGTNHNGYRLSNRQLYVPIGCNTLKALPLQ
jgi:hypothetical protein